MNTKEGKFITIEGQDGAGKTTNLALICDEIAAKNINHIVTREPGGTPLGEAIREILLNRNELEITPVSELLLMFAARAQHLDSIIEPALKEGIWVVCDRFTDASYAYQGGGHGLGPSNIATLASMIQKGREPDLTILLDLEVQIGESRVSTRNEEKDRYEKQKSNFKKRVRETYLQLAEENPYRIQIVDASKNIENVSLKIQNILQKFLENA